MSEFEPCDVCGDDADFDLEHCAGCGRRFCEECGDWCHAPHDLDDGDYFCKGCQV